MSVLSESEKVLVRRELIAALGPMDDEKMNGLIAAYESDTLLRYALGVVRNARVSATPPEDIGDHTPLS